MTVSSRFRVLSSRFVFTFACVVTLALTIPAPAHAQQAATTPFTDGIADASSLERVVNGRIARARQLLESMLAVKGPRTVANTLAPYDDLLGELFTAGGQVGVMAELHPDAATRETAEKLELAVNSLLDEIPLRPDVHAALSGIDLRGADAAS